MLKTLWDPNLRTTLLFVTLRITHTHPNCWQTNKCIWLPPARCLPFPRRLCVWRWRWRSGATLKLRRVCSVWFLTHPASGLDEQPPNQAHSRFGEFFLLFCFVFWVCCLNAAMLEACLRDCAWSALFIYFVCLLLALQAWRCGMSIPPHPPPPPSPPVVLLLWFRVQSEGFSTTVAIYWKWTRCPPPKYLLPLWRSILFAEQTNAFDVFGLMPMQTNFAFANQRV